MEKQKFKFITQVKVLELMENGEDFTLVEVLAEENYGNGHIPKAINIPVDKIELKAAELLPDKASLIVVYCASFLCSASTGATRLLQSMGYTNVLDYKGGKADWERVGLPLITG